MEGGDVERGPGEGQGASGPSLKPLRALCLLATLIMLPTWAQCVVLPPAPPAVCPADHAGLSDSKRQPTLTPRIVLQPMAISILRLRPCAYADLCPAAVEVPRGRTGLPPSDTLVPTASSGLVQRTEGIVGERMN